MNYLDEDPSSVSPDTVKAKTPAEKKPADKKDNGAAPKATMKPATNEKRNFPKR